MVTLRRIFLPIQHLRLTSLATHMPPLPSLYCRHSQINPLKRYIIMESQRPWTSVSDKISSGYRTTSSAEYCRTPFERIVADEASRRAAAVHRERALLRNKPKVRAYFSDWWFKETLCLFCRRRSYFESISSVRWSSPYWWIFVPAWIESAQIKTMPRRKN